MSKIRTLKGTPKHLSKTGELKEFTYLMLNLPFACNYRCIKCFNLENDNPSNEKNQQYLTLDERLTLIDQSADLGGRVVVIAGEGEPSINKSIHDIISYANRKGMVSIVYSNGSTVNEDFAKFYKENNTALVFSLDSLIPTKYDMLTQTKGMFPNAMRNIQSAVEMYGGPLLQQELEIYSIAINTTVSNMNEDEVEHIKELFGERVYFICNPLAKLGNASTYWKMFGNDEVSVTRHQEMIQRLSETGGPLTLGSDGLCGYSAWGISVSPSGEYMTCAYQTDLK